MYRQYPFSEQKQQKAKVIVKETEPTCSQELAFPCYRKSVVLTQTPAGKRPGDMKIFLLLETTADSPI